MPRLPMIRVTGSQAISTSFLSGRASLSAVIDLLLFARSVRPAWVVSAGERRVVVMPLRLFVRRRVRDSAKTPNEFSVRSNQRRRHGRTGRLVHERLELVRKPRHRAPDADAAHVRT